MMIMSPCHCDKCRRKSKSSEKRRAAPVHLKARHGEQVVRCPATSRASGTIRRGVAGRCYRGFAVWRTDNATANPRRDR
jgi:hypothetical protein